LFRAAAIPAGGTIDPGKAGCLMYPFKIVVIGCSEQEQATLRRGLSRCAALVLHELADPDRAINHRPSLAEERCLFMVKLNAADDLTRLLRLNRAFPGKPILGLLNADSDCAAVISTLRAGAAQVVIFPLRGDDLQAALEAIARQFGIAAETAPVLAVSAVTEGAGATTLAINLADAVAAAAGKSCTLVELAARFGRLASYLDIEPPRLINDLLAGSENLDVESVKNALARVNDKLLVAAGPSRALGSQPIAAARVARLIECLRSISEVVVLDLPCTYDDAYFETLRLADQVVLVADHSVPSVQALKVVADAITERAAGIRQHFVINRFDPGAGELTAQQLADLFPASKLWFVPDERPAFRAALNAGRCLRQAAPRCGAIPVVAELTRTALGLKGGQPDRTGSWWSNFVAYFQKKELLAN